MTREPQSNERPKPSATPVLAGLVILALSIMLPYVLMALGYVVIGLVVLIVVTRKLGLGWGLGSIGARRDRQDKPRVLVTNFRVGIPKPDDPRSSARELSCRLITRQSDGPVELSGGDQVAITGRRSRGQLVTVGSLTVVATGSRTRSAPGASAQPVVLTTLILLALSAATLWLNRAWLSPDVLGQAVLAVRQSLVQLVTLVVLVVVMWFVIKKMIFRR